MAVIKVDNFGGEIPRLPARGLPAGAAQINSNLLATAMEFRPMLADSVVSTAPTGAKTLYRLSKNASGVERTLDTAGWIAEVVDKNYVRGQINDDATERTYISFNDGSDGPFVLDALGSYRRLGVPAPSALSVTLNASTEVTRDDANSWADMVLLPGLDSAIYANTYFNDPGSRFNDTTKQPVAGPYTPITGDGVTALSTPTFPISQRGLAENWNLLRSTPTATIQAAGLGDPQLDGTTVGSNVWFTITALPKWPVIDAVPLRARLAAMTKLGSSSALLTTSQLNSYMNAVLARYDSNSAAVKSLRDQLQTEVNAFEVAFSYLIATRPTRPTAPTRPNAAEYNTTTDIGGNTTTERAAVWVTYDTAIATYNSAVVSYNTAQTDIENQITSKVARLVACRAKAVSLTVEIERMGVAIVEGLPSWVTSLTGLSGLIQTADNPNGLVAVVPDRLVESRFYFATHTTDRGEESAPSRLTALLEVDQYKSVTLALPAPPSGRYITKTNLYRSNVGTLSAYFQFVAAIPVATTTYTDTRKNSELGEICPTVTWAEPPAGLRGLVGMPNGVMAGFFDNTVAFCDPYHPYAWPVEYQISLKYPVVGLGVFGQSLVVGTHVNPSIISGSDSASMSEQRMDDAQACLSSRSMVSVDGGVLYASPDGICFASQNGVELVTIALFAREDWQALNPASIVAAMHEGVYHFWFAGTASRAAGCYALDMVAKKLVRLETTATAVFADSLTDALFYVDGTSIKRAFSTGRRVGSWKSAKLEIAAEAVLCWGKVMGDQTPENPVTLVWTGDGVVRYTKTVTDTKPWRLPPGRYLEHELQISGASRVTKVFLASSTDELKGFA